MSANTNHNNSEQYENTFCGLDYTSPHQIMPDKVPSPKNLPLDV